MADQHDVDLDSIIDRLLEVRGSRPGKQVQLLEAEIRYLCTKAREIFISQPILLELEAPIKVRRSSPFRTVMSAMYLGLLWFQRSHQLTRPTLRFAATSTANTMISFVSSSMAVSRPKPTTFS